MDDIALILRLYNQPATAISGILDRGSLVFGLIAVLALSFLLGHSLHGISFYMPLFALAVAYVPCLLAAAGIAGRVAGGFAASFRRDYAPLLTCTAAAWTAANLPLLVVIWFLPQLFAIAGGLAYLYFSLLIFFAVRTVFGTGNGAAVVVVCLSWIFLFGLGVGVYFAWGPLRFLLGWLTSPFILLYLLYFLRGEFSDLGAGLRKRRSFRRNLEAAAINPHDGEAQYQLGLIFRQRRQTTEAIRRFQNAVQIDPSHTDAHFQLGRIAREQGRLKDALEQFQIVIDQDPRHSQSEILRELGALYNEARQFEDARHELEGYVKQRPYDPEGLFHYGQALESLGENTEARDAYERAAEAANLAPSYLRRTSARWGRMARKQVQGLRV